MKRILAFLMLLAALCGAQYLADCAFGQTTQPAGVRGRGGQNVTEPRDYGRQFEYRDAEKTARPFEQLPGGPPLQLRPDGWPASDASQYVFTAGDTTANGVYRFSAKGKVALKLNASPAKILAQRYDPATDTTTAEVEVKSADPNQCQLRAYYTQTAGGISNIKWLRPGYEDDGRASGNPFTDEFTSLIKTMNSSVLRSMSWLSTNGSRWVEWDGRVKVVSPQYFTDGAPLEDFVLLCNVTQCDLWLNLPHGASDDLARKAIDYAISNLDPGLFLYAEYTNENWNWGNSSFKAGWQYSINQARAARAAGDARFDPKNDEVARRQWYALRSAQLADVAVEVATARGRGHRIRPILGGQASNTSVLQDEIDFLNKYLGGAKSHFYGACITGYFGAGTFCDRDDLTLEDFFRPGYHMLVKTGKDAAGKDVYVDQSFPGIWMADRAMLWRGANQQTYLKQCRDNGLKACVYEGGFSLGESGHSVAAKTAVCYDPRTEQYVYQCMQDFYDQAGDTADVFCQFLLANRYGVGFYGATDSARRPDMPKVRAIARVFGAKVRPLAGPDESPEVVAMRAKLAAAEKEVQWLRTSLGEADAEIGRINVEKGDLQAALELQKAARQRAAVGAAVLLQDLMAVETKIGEQEAAAKALREQVQRYREAVEALKADASGP